MGNDGGFPHSQQRSLFTNYPSARKRNKYILTALNIMVHRTDFTAPKNQWEQNIRVGLFEVDEMRGL